MRAMLREVLALTETGYVGLWTELPGQGKDILVGRKLVPLTATIEDEVLRTNVNQSLNKQESKCNSIHWPEQRCVAYIFQLRQETLGWHLGGSSAL